MSELTIYADKEAAAAAPPPLLPTAMRGENDGPSLYVSVGSASASLSTSAVTAGGSNRASKVHVNAQFLQTRTVLLLLAVAMVGGLAVILCRKLAAPKDPYSRAQAAKP